VAKKIKQYEAGKKALLVLMTGEISEKDMDKHLFVAAIEKPVSMSSLASLIEDLLKVNVH
jgi:hypothetical protein